MDIIALLCLEKTKSLLHLFHYLKVKQSVHQGEYIFLFFLLMAFWILIFLIGFLGYWSIMGGLNSLMPGMFEKKEEETAKHE